MIAVDAEFSHAHWSALAGDATAMAAILRTPNKVLDEGEREYLAMMIERLAEYARGDIGGNIGRRFKAAGHPDVCLVVERFNALVREGHQKSEAKAIVADSCNVSLRTVENYLKLVKDRDEVIASVRDRLSSQKRPPKPGA